MTLEMIAGALSLVPYVAIAYVIYDTGSGIDADFIEVKRYITEERFEPVQLKSSYKVSRIDEALGVPSFYADDAIVDDLRNAIVNHIKFDKYRNAEGLMVHSGSIWLCKQRY